MGKRRGKGRININFRQTMSAFRGARQATIFAKVNRNLPYNILTFSKGHLEKQIQQLKRWRGKEEYGSSQNWNDQKKKT